MHTLFLLNPTAGKTDCTQQLPQQINAAAARAGLAPEEYTIRITTHAGHARELARAAAAGAQQAGEPLRIFTAGGDGTFNEALTGAYGFAGTAVGCLPYGSGNDFLRTFGTREEFLDLDAQLAGGAVPIDLMQTNLGLSATICAAGLDAQVAYGIPKFRRIPLCGGEVSYLLSIVEQLCGHIGRRVEYTIDGETFAVDCLMCAICNGRTYGGGFCAGPEAQPEDGWLDVFIVRKVGRLTIAKLLSMYKNGRHFQNAGGSGKALFHLPPGQGCDPARRRWTRAHHCHSGRRMCPLRAGARGGAAAGRTGLAAKGCLPQIRGAENRRKC